MCIDIYLWMMVNITIHTEVVILVTSRHNITLDPEVYEEFCRYAGKKGIKNSTWINQQMKNFIEEEKMIEEIRKKRSE
jgi:hypothetical protein